MRTFSFKSYWNTFKWMMFSNYRDLLTIFGGIIIATIVLEEFYLLTAFGTDVTNEGMVNSIFGIFIFGFFGNIWMLYGASRTFADIKERQSAITMLMHPATNLEKYAARITYYTILWALLAVVGIFIGDTVRCSFNAITGWHTGKPIFIEPADEIIKALFQDKLSFGLIVRTIFSLSSFAIWGHSFYVLGSAFFRRNQFLFTTIAVIIVQSFVGTLSTNYLDESLYNNQIIFENILPLYVLGAIHYWLAYKLFTRMQVINNKWINL